MERVWFIPGRSGAPRGPLARFRPVQPVGAAGAYVQRFTRSGDLVVDLFCQGATIVQETANAGRRALGLSVNPVLLVAARLGLDRREPGALNAAFTRLADSPKGEDMLRRYLASLYRSACPICGAPGIAEWFAWDRNRGCPFRKAVRCSKCGGVQEGRSDDEDLQAARRIQPRGLAYYYALDRVAPLGHPARGRAAELLELYTPRNLSALMDLCRRLEGLEAGEEVRIGLTGVLLDCFDAGCSLDPYGEERPRPRTLRVPTRYIERNVWICFEERFSRLLAEDTSPPPQTPPRSEEGDRMRRGQNPAALAGGEGEGYALEECAARDAEDVVPSGGAALIFADPPRPDGVFWALSALWAGWLWDSPASQALRPFLRRRRFDWDWHWRVLRVALDAAGPLLSPAGYLATMFSDPDPTLLESTCLAASGAGYDLEGWGYSREVGYRLVWRWKPEVADRGSQSNASDPETMAHDLTAVARDAMVDALRARGEPASWALLHACAYARLAERGLLARAVATTEQGSGASVLAFAADAVRRALEAAPLLQLAGREATEEPLWWLAHPGRAVEPPLADRVESVVCALLAQRPAWDLEELVDGVYARFPGPLTPELTLVQVCIDSYSVEEGDALRLRPEDEPQQRVAELEVLRQDLAQLGQRLGFRVGRRVRGWDVRWLEGGQEMYVFAISAAAALGSHLLASRVASEGAQRCLVLPGGRARLVDLKLQRDPRLARSVELDGWQFIKFRHVRRLVAKEELDRHALKTVLGLDPIAEQEAAQIPLF